MKALFQLAMIAALTSGGLAARAQDPTDPTTNGDWVEMGFTFESDHPYRVGQVFSVPVKIEGAKKMKFVLPRVEMENSYDFLEVYDGDGHLVASYTGNKPNQTTPEIVGDYAFFNIKQDSSDSTWGFQVTKVLVQY